METDLFAQTYKNYGQATMRYPVLEVTTTVEPFENGRGFSLRVAGGEATSSLTLARLENVPFYSIRLPRSILTVGIGVDAPAMVASRPATG
jgi:hypothetical protein